MNIISQPHPAKTFSSIEALESRIAPAGVVSVVVAGGGLTLAGDALANSITIDSTNDGSLTVTGLTGTKLLVGGVQVNDFTLPGFSGDLKVALGDGADTVNLLADALPRNVTLDGGKGANNYTVSSKAVQGSLNILGKGDADTLTIDSGQILIGKDLNISFGDGTNEALGTGGAITVLGKFNYTGGAGTDDLFLDIENLKVSGAATIKTGGSADTVDLRTTFVQQFGSLSITTNPAANATAAINLQGAIVDVVGALSVVGGAGNENLHVPGDQLVVGGKASLALGGGANSIEIDVDRALFLKDLAIKNTGNMSTTIKADDVFLVGAAFSYLGGTGIDNLTMNVAGKIVGAATIDLGAALGNGSQEQDLTLGGNDGVKLTIVGALTMKSAQASGSSVTTLSGVVARGVVSSTSGASIDDVFINDVLFDKAVTFSTGASSDTFEFETQGGSEASTVNGPFKLLLGDGGDTASIGFNSAQNRVNFNSTVFVDAGPGTDITNILNRGNVFAGPPPVILNSEASS